MFDSNSSKALFCIFICLLVLYIVKSAVKKRFFFGSYLTYTLIFFLSFCAAEFISVKIGIWILALLSFTALREYFSLIDVRLQDRLAILGAYLSIPFMYYFVQINWYGMFIISIPVYSFLAIPLLVTLGGKESRGTVFSIGAIDFGLFLYVFCLGHIGYLLLFGVWKPTFLIIIVAMCDIMTCFLTNKTRSKTLEILLRYLTPLPLTIFASWILSSWTGIPPIHAIIIGAFIPILVLFGHHTANYIKADLGVSDDDLFPGRGQILDNLKSFFYAAPVVFHYIRYFLT